MNWLELLTIIICMDIVTIATYKYAKNVIRVHFPNWWKQVICDDYPLVIEQELDEVPAASSMALTHLDPRN